MSITLPAIPDNVTTSKRAQQELVITLAEVMPDAHSPGNVTGFKRAMKQWSVDDLTSAGTGLIHYLDKLEADATDVRRALAGVIVALRRHYRTNDGDVDWAGRSWEYRQAVTSMYQSAGIRPDSESKVQASLRYHVGNLLREVAPPQQLAAVGLLTNSPKERMNDVRQATNAILHNMPSFADAGPEQGRSRRQNAAETVNRTVMGIYSLLSSLEHNPAIWEGLNLKAAEQYDETLEELSEKLATIREQLASTIAAKWETS